MDFSLTDEQQQLKRSVIEFARKELADDVISRDRDELFRHDLWKKCAEFGIQGLPFPTAYGGQGADIMTSVLAMEGLGYASRDNGLVFGLNAQMWSVQMPILNFGTEEQRRQYLPALCSGGMIGAHGMSEPGSGSDAFALSTRAVRDGDHYVLTGSKTFVSLAPVADVFVIFATVNKKLGFFGVTAFLVDKNTPGFRVGKRIEKMGLRTCPWAEVFLEDCRIPVGNRLGKEGSGSSLFNDSMEWERGCLLAGTVGAMERQLETCVRYARERKQFKAPIGKFQSVANRIVEMRLRLETSRLLLYKLAWEKSQGQRSPLTAAMVKLHLSEVWKQSCLDAIQIHGGYGFTTEYEVEREFRDSIGGTIYSGTSEIQRNIIADVLGL